MWFLVGIGIALLSYAIMPKPKNKQPQSKPQDVQAPTVDAGRPIPVLFGRKRIKGPNVLTFGGQHSEEVRK